MKRIVLCLLLNRHARYVYDYPSEWGGKVGVDCCWRCGRVL